MSTRRVGVSGTPAQRLRIRRPEGLRPEHQRAIGVRLAGVNGGQPQHVGEQRLVGFTRRRVCLVRLPKLDTRVRFPSPASTPKPQVRDPLPACDFPVVGPKIPPRARYMPNQERGSCPSCPFAPPDRALCEASMRLSRASATSRAAAHRLGRIRPRGQGCSGCLIARIEAGPDVLLCHAQCMKIRGVDRGTRRGRSSNRRTGSTSMTLMVGLPRRR